MRTITLAALVCLGWGPGNLQAQVIGLPWGTPAFPPPIAPASYGFSSPFSPYGGNPYGGFPFGGYGYGYGYGYGGYGWGTGSYILPGFTAAEPPRMRATVYPAIPLPPRQVIAAKLSGVDDSKAFLTLVVPQENALVWLNGAPMSLTGLERRFVTPPLDPGEYIFQVRVQWQDEFGPQTRTRKVYLSPGSDRTVNIR